MGTRDDIKKLFKKFLATLDDIDHDEWYTTDRGAAKSVFHDFWKWLRKQEIPSDWISINTATPDNERPVLIAYIDEGGKEVENIGNYFSSGDIWYCNGEWTPVRFWQEIPHCSELRERPILWDCPKCGLGLIRPQWHDICPHCGTPRPQS